MKLVLRTIIPGLGMLLAGCSRSQEAFRTVQMCLSNDVGIRRLEQLMRSTAEAERLQFTDNSMHVAKSLEVTAQTDAQRQEAIGAIDLHIEGKAGLGATASNLGLGQYDVAIGFTAGEDAGKAHLLAERLVKDLSHYFQVLEVPLGRGAMPLKGCGG